MAFLEWTLYLLYQRMETGGCIFSKDPMNTSQERGVRKTDYVFSCSITFGLGVGVPRII